MSHLGRPDGNANPNFSLKPIVPKLEEILKTKVHFISTPPVKAIEEVKSFSKGEVVLLENLRFFPEEEGKFKLPNGEKKKAKKEKVVEFRKALSSMGKKINDLIIFYSIIKKKKLIEKHFFF